MDQHPPWMLHLDSDCHGYLSVELRNVSQCPCALWKLEKTNTNCVSNPGTFITVLSGWSVFLSPMTGIVVSDYFLVRHGEYHIGDMYMGNSRSAYWYTGGFNWRCFTAWILGMGPLLRKYKLHP